MSTVALIAANPKSWQTISAAAVEITIPGSAALDIKLRIAQNGGVLDSGLASLNGILDNVLDFVNGSGGEHWRGIFIQS